MYDNDQSEIVLYTLKNSPIHTEIKRKTFHYLLTFIFKVEIFYCQALCNL